jgi:hypothetical protein
MKKIEPLNTFSVPRFIQLCKRTIELNLSSWLLGLAAVLGILLIIWFLPILAGGNTWHGYRIETLLPAALSLFVLGGLFITSSIFNELHSPTTAFQHLTLPATALEKLLSAWAVTTVFYTLVSIVTYFLLTLIIQLITALISTADLSIRLFNPLDFELAESVVSYFYYHSIFLLGAVYFAKNNFLKTLVSIVLVVSTLILITGLVFFVSAGTITFQFSTDDLASGVIHTVSILFSLFMLTIAWIRLKNRQVA